MGILYIETLVSRRLKEDASQKSTDPRTVSSIKLLQNTRYFCIVSALSNFRPQTDITARTLIIDYTYLYYVYYHCTMLTDILHFQRLLVLFLNQDIISLLPVSIDCITNKLIYF